MLNAATAASQSDASILYYGLDQQLSLNDKALNEETPLAAFQSKEYQSADEAAAAVNVTADDGGQAVDLGYGITGHMQGAAGSSYLSWQEGNWSLTVRAVNQEEQDPVPVAKEVVAYLEEAMLPAPEVGQITIDMGKMTIQQLPWSGNKKDASNGATSRCTFSFGNGRFNESISFRLGHCPFDQASKGVFRAMILRKTGALGNG